MKDIIIRPYTLDDYNGLLSVQKEAFPAPFPEDLWWSKEQIQAHVQTFPGGALLAVIDGTIIGSATSLLITYKRKAHTWAEVADHGYIRGSHDPAGDSLYGIDVCVHPRYRGAGVATALYAARKQFVLRHGLTRFIAGCRIPGFQRYEAEMSVETYVNKVSAGKLYDQVLSFMLRQGLQPLHILPNYLEDEESCHFGILVEWTPGAHSRAKA